MPLNKAPSEYKWNVRFKKLNFCTLIPKWQKSKADRGQEWRETRVSGGRLSTKSLTYQLISQLQRLDFPFWDLQGARETGNKTENPPKMGNPIENLLRTLNPNSCILIVKGERGVKSTVRKGTGRKVAWHWQNGGRGTTKQKNFPLRIQNISHPSCKSVGRIYNTLSA